MTDRSTNMPVKASERPRGASRAAPAPVPPRAGEMVRYTVAGTGVILPAVVVAATADRATLQVFRMTGDGTYLVTEVPRGRPGEPRTWHPADGG